MKLLLKETNKIKQRQQPISSPCPSSDSRSISAAAPPDDTMDDDEAVSDGSQVEDQAEHQRPDESSVGRPLKKAKYAWQFQTDMTSTTNLNVNDRLKVVAIDDDGDDNDPTARPSTSAVDLRLTCNVIRPSTSSHNVEVHPASYSLHRWQTKQMAQGIIDNAINNVLGDMGGLDRTDQVDGAYNQVDPLTWGHYLRAQNIENEGVAEAIRQQGLQKRASLVADAESTSWSSRNQHQALPSGLATNPSASSTNSEDKTMNEDLVELHDQNNASRQSDSESDILTTAVSCAINHKGLGMLAMMEQQP